MIQNDQDQVIHGLVLTAIAQSSILNFWLTKIFHLLYIAEMSLFFAFVSFLYQTALHIFTCNKITIKKLTKKIYKNKNTKTRP